SDPFTSLGQANAIASAVGALLWLALRRHIYGRRELSLSSCPLLGAQVVLGLVGNGLLLLPALLQLISLPTATANLVAVGEVWGWLALVLALAAALWYADQVAPAARVHCLVIFGLAAGVLAAGTVAPWDRRNWLSFHALTVCWCLTGLATLA